MITSAPRSAAWTACATVVTCTITREPASCACCTSSPGSPSANEITAGRAASVWANASASSSCGTWLIAYGRSVSFRTMSMSRLMASVVRNSEPMLPRPPWLETATANSADVAEPIGARTMGTSMPRRSHSAVLGMGTAPAGLGPLAQCVPDRERGGLGSIGRVGLAQDAAHMVGDGVGADEQLERNLAVALARGDEAQNLGLALAQTRRVTR